MKIILYITTISRTINAFLVPHIQMLRNQGHMVDCACSIDIPIDDSLINDGVRVFDIPFSRNPLHPGNIKAFKKLGYKNAIFGGYMEEHHGILVK